MTETTEIERAKMPVIMKGGLTHWVSEATWLRISDVLANQKQHSFMRIAELGNIVINTAEVLGAYSVEQYDDLSRIKQGMWQCAYRKWHLKKGECECKRELLLEHQKQMKRIKQSEENRPLTPEQKEILSEAVMKGNEEAALKGSELFRSRFKKGNRSGAKIRRSTVREWEEKTGKKADVTNLVIDEKL